MRAVLIVLAITSSVLLHAQDYEMHELQLLLQQKQYGQLLLHAADIPPSKRTKTWRTLVEQSIIKQFDLLLKTGNAKTILPFLHKYLQQFPTLTEDKIFMQKRATYGLEYYSRCFSYNDEKCHNEFLSFVALDPNTSYAFKVAKQVRLRMSDSKAIHYFSLANKDISPTQCHDEDLATAVEKSLTLKPDSNEAVLAKELAFGTCHEALKSSIKQAIRTNNNGIANSCKLAVAHNSIEGIALSKCKRYLANKGL